MSPVFSERGGNAAGEGSDDRNAAADANDRLAGARDVASEGRDEQAEMRDQQALAREGGLGSTARARVLSQIDRQRSADDRRRAASDRKSSKQDRELAAQERSAMMFDGLTGAYLRAPGLVELEREVNQAQQTRSAYTVAFIDIDNLKAVNDALGHAAGDSLIRQTVAQVRGIIREYDVLVRYGGDEFVCGLTNAILTDVSARFDTNASTTAGRIFTAGVAQLCEGEDLGAVIGRADKAMYLAKHRG